MVDFISLNRKEEISSISYVFSDYICMFRSGNITSGKEVFRLADRGIGDVPQPLKSVNFSCVATPKERM